MILRLRSRDGLERVEVPDAATLGQLKQAISDTLLIPLADMQLSKNPGLLTSKTPQEYSDLSQPASALKALSVSHGDMLFMLYSGERNVQPAFKKSVLDTRPFGEKLTVAQIAAKIVRIERQEKAVVGQVSLDKHAAHQFLVYVRDALAFSIQRGGLLYGSVDADNNVKVDFIYEPPQEGKPLSLKLHRDTDEAAQVDWLASRLGLTKVGWVFSQSTVKKDYDSIMNTSELISAASMQGELGEAGVSVVVSMDPETNETHFEAFQCSKQCVQLTKDGWLVGTPEGTQPGGVTQLRNPAEPRAKEPVMVAGKDAGEVDNDYFLCAMGITQHESSLTHSFPIENRLLPQGKAELREHLKRMGSRPYVEKISDLHLLLWLSKQPNLDQNDMMLLVDAVRDKAPVLEGYRVIIDSIAGL